MRISIRSAVPMLAVLLWTGTAWAHAHLVSAVPAPGSTVQTAPDALSIDFTEGVEPQFCTVTVQDADDHSVATGAPAVASDNNKRLSIGLAKLTPGVYRVIWHATAVDTHKTEGTFQFTVKP